MMTNDELAEIEARLYAATPGPWVYDYPLVGKYNEDHFYDALCCIDDSVTGSVAGRANCYLIANAPTDIAALIAEVRRLQAENEALRNAGEEMYAAIRLYLAKAPDEADAIEAIKVAITALDQEQAASRKLHAFLMGGTIAINNNILAV